MSQNKNKKENEFYVGKNMIEIGINTIFQIGKYIYEYTKYLYNLKFFKANNYLFKKFYIDFFASKIDQLNKLYKQNKFFIDPQSFFVYFLKTYSQKLKKAVSYLEYFFEKEPSILLKENEKSLIDNFKKYLFVESGIEVDAKLKYWQKVLYSDGKINYYGLANFISWLWYFALTSKQIELFNNNFGLDKFEFNTKNLGYLLNYFSLFELEDKITDLNYRLPNFIEKIIQKSSLSHKDLQKIFDYRASLKNNKERKKFNLVLKYELFSEFYYMKLLEDYLLKGQSIGYQFTDELEKDFKKIFSPFDKFIEKGLALPRFLEIFYKYVLWSSLNNYFSKYPYGKVALQRFKFLSLLWYARYVEKFNWLVDFWARKDSFLWYVKFFVVAVLIIGLKLWGLVVAILIFGSRYLLEIVQALKGEKSLVYINNLISLDNRRFAMFFVLVIFILAGLLVSFLNIKADVNGKINIRSSLFPSTGAFTTGYTVNVYVNNLVPVSKEKKDEMIVKENRQNINKLGFGYIRPGMYLWNWVEKILKQKELSGQLYFESDLERAKFIKRIIKDYIALQRDYLLKHSYCGGENLANCLKTNTKIDLDLINRLIENNIEK